MAKKTTKLTIPIKPGDIVTHPYTGHKGVAAVVAQRHSGRMMVAVQQQGLTADHKEFRSHWTSWADLTTAPEPPLDPLLGLEGTDEQTKAKGRVVCVQDHIKGCRLIEFELKKLKKDGDPADDLLIDAGRFIPDKPPKEAPKVGHGYSNAGCAH